MNFTNFLKKSVWLINMGELREGFFGDFLESLFDQQIKYI